MSQGKEIFDSMTDSSGDGIDMTDSGHYIFLVELCHNSEGGFQDVQSLEFSLPKTESRFDADVTQTLIYSHREIETLLAI